MVAEYFVEAPQDKDFSSPAEEPKDSSFPKQIIAISGQQLCYHTKKASLCLADLPDKLKGSPVDSVWHEFKGEVDTRLGQVPYFGGKHGICKLVLTILVSCIPGAIGCAIWVASPCDEDGSTYETTGGGERCEKTVGWTPLILGLALNLVMFCCIFCVQHSREERKKEEQNAAMEEFWSDIGKTCESFAGRTFPQKIALSNDEVDGGRYGTIKRYFVVVEATGP